MNGGIPLTPAQEAFNADMARGRIAVEWSFTQTVANFSFLDVHKRMKIWGTPVGHYYHLASILTNAHNCLYGSQCARYFGVMPPTLEDYFLLL